MAALRRSLGIGASSLVLLALVAAPAAAASHGPKTTLTNRIISLYSDPSATVVSGGVCTFKVTMEFSITGSGFAEASPRLNGTDTGWFGYYLTTGGTYTKVINPQLTQLAGQSQTVTFDGRLVEQSHGKFPQDVVVAELDNQGPAATCPAG